MKSNEWGPHIWVLIHLVAFNIPNEKYFQNFINYYYSFYYALRDVIPCPVCRNHLRRILDNNPPEKCKTSKQLKDWTIEIHNTVNKSLGKPVMEKEEVYKLVFYTKSLYFGMDTIALNRQYVIPLKAYSVFFNTLRVVFPIPKVRKALINAMANIPVRVKKHKDLVDWYMRLGNYIKGVI